MVLVYFVQGSHEVKLVRDINAEIPYLGFQVKGYAPEKYILPDPPKSTPYRRLVVP